MREPSSAPVSAASSPRRRSGRRPAARVGEGALLVLLLLAPLPFGAVQKAATFALIAWAAALAWIVLPARDADLSPLARPRWAAAIALAVGFGLAQAVPLPRGSAHLLAPAVVRAYESVPGATPGGRLPLSLHGAASLEMACRIAAYAAVFAAAAALAARGRGAGKRILTAVFAVGLFQALYGSYEYLTGHQHIFGYAKRFYTDSATGTYINQNHYAGALEMALLCGLGLWLSRVAGASVEPRRSHGWRARIVALFEGGRVGTMAIGIALALCALGLVFSYSRMGLAAASLAGAGVVLVDLKRSSGKRRRAVVLLAAAGLLLGSLAGWNRIASDLGRQLTPISLEEGRLRVWRDSVAIARDHPLTGTGLGTFRDVYPAYRDTRITTFYDHVHNDWIELAVETGAAGAALALVLLALYAASVARGLARLRGPEFPLLLGAAGALVALLLHEVTDFNLQIPANAVLFAAIAGTLIGSLRAADRGGGRIVSFRASGRREAGAHEETRRTGPNEEDRGRARWLSRGRLAGAGMALATTFAAAGAWGSFEGQRLLGTEASVAPARDDAAAAAATAPEVEDLSRPGDDTAAASSSTTAAAERLETLERAADYGAAEAEARAAIADLLVDRAVAQALGGDVASGSADSGGVRGESAGSAAAPTPVEDLRRALGEVHRALRACPSRTDAWIAGYRVSQLGTQLGAFDSAGAGGGESRGAHDPAFAETLAHEFADGAVRSDPYGGRPRRRLAGLLLAAGERDAALEGYCAAAKDPSQDPRSLATEMLDGGFGPESIAACLPDRYDAHAALAGLLGDRRLTAPAEREWQRAAALDPAGGAAAWTRLSNLAAAQGRPADALAYARRAMAGLDAANASLRAEILYAAAMASRASGDVQSAIDAAERAIAEDPGQLFLYHLAATLHDQRGDTAEAIKLWKRLLEEHAQDLYVIENRGLFHRSLGSAYERLGLTDPAADQYRQALEASPRDNVSRDALKRLLKSSS